jgi:YesN/AraC family two-component response regulator
MNNESLLQSLSIRSEYETDFSEKTTKLKMTLEDAILSGNMEAVRQVASDAEHIKDIKILLDEDLDILKLYIASKITSFVAISIKRGLPKDEAELIKKKYYTRIAQCRNKEELTNDQFQIVKELIEATNRYSLHRYSPIVKMAIEYIHNNKFTFIFSKDVSDAIKVNRSYLSKKFSEEVGETITDYIHRIKMDLAIELMQSNVYRFNEIAELLGYANYPYFSKVFKKIHSKTPHAYIKDN